MEINEEYERAKQEAMEEINKDIFRLEWLSLFGGRTHRWIFDHLPRQYKYRYLRWVRPLDNWEDIKKEHNLKSSIH